MTTRVTVDAHAGWPVKVEALDGIGENTEIIQLAVLNAGEHADFHATDTRKILVTEMTKDDS